MNKTLDEKLKDLPRVPYAPENIGTLIKMYSGLFGKDVYKQKEAMGVLQDFESRVIDYPECSPQRYYLEDLLGIAYDHSNSREDIEFEEVERKNFANGIRKYKSELANEMVRFSSKTANYTRSVSIAVGACLGYATTQNPALAGAIATITLGIAEFALRIGSKLYKIRSNQKADKKLTEAGEWATFEKELVYECALYHACHSYNNFIEKKYDLAEPSEFYESIRKRRESYYAIKTVSPPPIVFLQKSLPSGTLSEQLEKAKDGIVHTSP